METMQTLVGVRTVRIWKGEIARSCGLTTNPTSE
jgi:hypothetical protein